MKFKLDHSPVAEERGYHRRIGTDGCTSRPGLPDASTCRILRPLVAMALSHSRSQLILVRFAGDNVKITTAYNRDNEAITSYIERTRQ